MNAILECHGLVKEYTRGYPVLSGLDLSVGCGRIVGLLGPNGSGKTTLLKLIAGLLTPTSGSVTVNGKAPCSETKAIVSYLPERTYFSDGMTVKETVEFFGDFYTDFDKARAYDMLKRLGIDPKSRMRTLSKGTKEKVQLILVMSRNARLYLLDEPIGGVDPAARDYILDTILSNYCENSTVIISTHLIQDIERVLDDVLFIAGGRIIEADSADNIRAEKGMSIDRYFREVFRC